MLNWNQLGGLRAANRARREVDRSLDWSQAGGLRASQLDPRERLNGLSIGPPRERLCLSIGGLGWTLPGSFTLTEYKRALTQVTN